MRLAVRNIASPFLARRTVVVAGDGGGWIPLAEALAEAGMAPSGNGGVAAALGRIAAMPGDQRRALEAALAAGGGADDDAGFVKPIDSDAKLLVIGGWNPVTRPDLAPPELVPHTMARWMSADDFERPPITAFKKFTSAIADPGAELALPVLRLVGGAASGGSFQADAAFAVVIGRPALRVSAEAALGHVFGLSLMVDLWDAEVFLEESRVRRGMLSRNLRGLSPLGPCIRAVGDGRIDDDLALEFRVNGALRQRFRIRDLSQRIADVVAFCSSMGLAPGDVLAFGARIAADGDGPLDTPVDIAPGDSIEVAAPGIGALRAAVVAGDGHD